MLGILSFHGPYLVLIFDSIPILQTFPKIYEHLRLFPTHAAYAMTNNTELSLAFAHSRSLAHAFSASYSRITQELPSFIFNVGNTSCTTPRHTLAVNVAAIVHTLHVLTLKGRTPPSPSCSCFVHVICTTHPVFIILRASPHHPCRVHIAFSTHAVLVLYAALHSSFVPWSYFVRALFAPCTRSHLTPRTHP